MQQRTAGNLIASRQWSKNIMFYVAQIAGDGGADWGYTLDRSKALRLNKHFARRFAADCDRVSAKVQFTMETF